MKGELHTFYWKPPELPAWALPQPPKVKVIGDAVADDTVAVQELVTQQKDFPSTPKDLLKQLIEKCSNWDELKEVWNAVDRTTRDAIGPEFLQQQKERLEVTA